MRRPGRRFTFIIGATTLTLLGATACRADDARGPQAGTPPEGYALQTLVDGPDGRTTYVHRLDDLTGEALDLEAALEVPGNSRVYARPGGLWSGSGESPEITPLLMDGEGRLQPDASRRLSLQALGFGQAPFGHVFLGDGRAYLFGETVAIWSPDAMTLDGEVDLSPASRGGRLPDGGLGVVRGNRAFVPVTYEPFPNVDPAVHVLVLDTSRDEVVDVIEDGRCHSTGSVHKAEDGTIYVSGDNGYILPRFGTDEVPSTCILRIQPGEDRFDPNWIIRIRDLTEGRDATGFRYLGDGHGVLFVFHRDELSDPDATDLRTFYEAVVSRWWRIDLEAAMAEPIQGIDFVVSGSGISSSLDGARAWLAAPTAFPATDNRFWEVGVDGPAVPRLAFEGRGLIWPL